MLCGYISRGMVDVFQKQSLKIGSDYDVISLSFDPTETRQLAYLKKQNYIAEYGRADEASGWHFLVGDSANIRRLTEAVGFQYRWIDSAQQYSHPAVLIILTPDGKVSRYLFGVQFDPRTFRLSLVEASDGKIGGIVDDFILTCFQFDGQTGKYALAAVGLMRVAAVIAVLTLGITLLVMFRRELRETAPSAPPAQPPTTPPS
jgi:protein SCO1/2